jgi:hypothetical protein
VVIRMNKPSRRKIVAAATFLGACVSPGSRVAWPLGPDERFDFTKLLGGWETVSGMWGIEEVGGASRNGRAFVQRATNNEFNVILAPNGPYVDVDASVRFKPMSGSENASGGIVFRFTEGRYYLVSANALKDNLCLYCYDRGLSLLASASVMAPMLGEWHTLRLLAKRNSLRGWLNSRPLINHRDSRFTAGRIGLWTEADSITAFDRLVIIPKDIG